MTQRPLAQQVLHWAYMLAFRACPTVVHSLLPGCNPGGWDHASTGPDGGRAHRASWFSPLNRRTAAFLRRAKAEAGGGVGDEQGAELLEAFRDSAVGYGEAVVAAQTEGSLMFTAEELGSVNRALLGMIRFSRACVPFADSARFPM